MDELPNKSYKVREVAQILGCTVENVYRLIKYGQLKAFKIGPRQAYVRVTDIELNDYIHRMEVRAEEITSG